VRRGGGVERAAGRGRAAPGAAYRTLRGLRELGRGRPDSPAARGLRLSRGNLEAALRALTAFARVRGAIGVEQRRRIDLGVDLRRSQARVAEQFLQAAQIGAGAEEVRGEAVTERMRRCGSGKAERNTCA